jgi:hypothetical protein
VPRERYIADLTLPDHVRRVASPSPSSVSLRVSQAKCRNRG